MKAAAAEAPAWASLGFERPTNVSTHEIEAEINSHGEQWAHAKGLLKPNKTQKKDGQEMISRPGNIFKNASQKKHRHTSIV